MGKLVTENRPPGLNDPAAGSFGSLNVRGVCLERGA